MSPLDLQRIVDGEIDHASRAKILQSLGDNVRDWQSLAMAFIEEQQWSRHLVDEFPIEAVSDKVPETMSAKMSAGVPTRVGFPWLTALAASVLVCIGLAGGMLVRGVRENDPRDSIAAGGTQNDGKLEPAPISTDKMVSGDTIPMKMVLTGFDGAQSPGLEIPMVNSKEIDPQTLWARDAREMAMLQQQLKRQGYRMEWKPQLYSGRLNDGSQVVIPVHNVALKSMGF